MAGGICEVYSEQDIEEYIKFRQKGKDLPVKEERHQKCQTFLLPESLIGINWHGPGTKNRSNLFNKVTSKSPHLYINATMLPGW